jgi:hypothetical protein
VCSNGALDRWRYGVGADAEESGAAGGVGDAESQTDERRPAGFAYYSVTRGRRQTDAAIVMDTDLDEAIVSSTRAGSECYHSEDPM